MAVWPTLVLARLMSDRIFTMLRQRVLGLEREIGPASSIPSQQFVTGFPAPAFVRVAPEIDVDQWHGLKRKN